MTTPDHPGLLLDRLEAIGRSLAGRGDALALLGLGSVGADTARLDRWSDLDFFVVVEPGSQDRYVAVDRVLALAATCETAAPASVDPWSPERRVEERFPALAEHLPTFVQGYDRTPESARAVLAWLTERFEVPDAMRDAVLRLCGPVAAEAAPRG